VVRFVGTVATVFALFLLLLVLYAIVRFAIVEGPPAANGGQQPAEGLNSTRSGGARRSDNPYMPTQVICKRIRLKPGSVPRVYEWARMLAARRDEVLATLQGEGVTVESAFLERAADGDYLIYYMRASDLQRASGAGARSTHPIDRYHQSFKREAWEDRTTLELLVDLEQKAGID
jgi:hypothetical protein